MKCRSNHICALLAYVHSFVLHATNAFSPKNLTVINDCFCLDLVCELVFYDLKLTRSKRS